MHRAFDLVDYVVDDGVQPDIHLLAVRQLGRLPFRADIKTDNDGIGRRRKQHVGFGDGADTRMQNADLHFFRAQLVQHFGERFL